MQMLGRGLRRGPGKDNCLVLDFTDKQHKVDHIIDLRVLLPKTSYRNLDPKPPPPQQDRRRKLKLEGQQGGEMSVLGEDIDPYDMAFVSCCAARASTQRLSVSFPSERSWCCLRAATCPGKVVAFGSWVCQLGLAFACTTLIACCATPIA